MKKLYPLLAFLLVAAIAALYGLDHYREVQEKQREQTAHLLSRCVNQGLLSLFRLQANDWQERPEYYRRQAEKLEASIGQLPQQLLDGEPFVEWQSATEICDKLTRHSNLQHKTIFRPLGRFASAEMRDSRTFKSRGSLRRRLRTVNRLNVAAQAADRYLDDLRMDIHNQLEDSDLSGESRRRALAEIDSEVLDYYRDGNFSRKRVDAYLQRVERYFKLLAENPESYSLRGGSLFFHDRDLRREIDRLNNAIIQGEADFFGSWTQIVQRQQRKVQK
ncbi:hypothetical protein [Microbulbifer halophilus]|uniref:DUF4041 domain-containing protein n=1 Tax=Microbulbifer halophilus TaxID=453963 RepID=A0ABW5E9B5_9GAMM